MANYPIFKKVILVVSLALTGHPSLSQDAPDNVLVLPAEEYPKPKLDVCKTALERGNIVKTDATGGLHIPFDGFYFVIHVDEKEMRCQMYRHIMGD